MPCQFLARLLFYLIVSTAWTGPAIAGDTPLHTAAEKGDIQSAEKLLKQGVDINIRDQEKRTPLQRAIQHKQARFARWLLTRGAEASARDRYKLRRLGVEKTPSPRPARPSDQPSVYDDIARATGGAVYKFPKGNYDGLSDIMIATMGTRNLLNREHELKGKDRIPVILDGDVGTAVFTVTAVRGKPQVQLVDPSGGNYSGSNAEKGIQRIDLENGMVFIVNKPRPGQWWIQMQGRGNLHVKAEVKAGAVTSRSSGGDSARAGRMTLHDFEFVELKGRPGHEGYFGTDQPLVPGETLTARVTLFDAPPDVRLSLVTDGGRKLRPGKAVPIPGADGEQDRLIQVVIPDVPFRLQAEGGGVKVQSERFEPDSDMLVFAYEPGEGMGLEDCQTAKFFMQVIQSEPTGTYGMVRCQIAQTKPMSFEFEMRFYIPYQIAASGKEAIFYPDPRYKYDAGQCETLKKFAHKFKATTRSGKYSVTRRSTCTRLSGQPRLQMQLDFSTR